MGYVERTCPLCDRQDVACEIDDHCMWFWYQCPHCGWFGISSLAADRLKDMPNSRAQIVKQAEGDNTQFLRISVDGSLPVSTIENRSNWRKAPPR